MCVYKEFYYKKLVHVIMEAGKSKMCRVSQLAEDPVESIFQFVSEDCLLSNQKEQMLQVKPAGPLLKNPLSLGESQPCVLFRPLTECMRPTCTSMLISPKNTFNNI